MAFGTAPEDIVNRALDVLGYVGLPVGDLNEGGTVANAAVRVYQTTRQQLLRAAQWNFARRMTILQLLNDATGQTTQAQIAAGGPVTVGPGTPGMYGWIYEYAWPVDCLRARWVPHNWNTTASPATANSYSISPQTIPGVSMNPIPPHLRPARFVVTTDNVPTLIGAISDWSQFPDYQGIQGQAPTQQTVILTNQRCAHLCYTADIVQPGLWDQLFEQAFVVTLASQLAMAVLPDKKYAIAMRDKCIASAKSALDQARVIDGDEQPQSTDHIPDWIKTRRIGGPWHNGWGGNDGIDGLGGGFGGGWAGMGFCDGSPLY
jgi:hypothetical protein